MMFKKKPKPRKPFLDITLLKYLAGLLLALIYYFTLDKRLLTLSSSLFA